MGTNDKRPDGVDTYPADQHDLDGYRQAEMDLERMRIPVLLHADNPHERLYIAALDGTGNSLFDDKQENWSAVAKIYDQVRLLDRQGVKNIAGGYVEGTFTQQGLLRTPERLWDGRYGHTFEDRIEMAYHQLCIQAKKWVDEDPKAEIRIVGVGFSRGAEEVAALERMIEERGIRDPADAKLVIDRGNENLITHIQYADKPLLVAPGKTLQAALLFDPVSTGVEEHDRRLPPSTLSTFQLTARDERRNLFKADEHIPVGFSENDRNYNVALAGAHSNIGNTYNENGLGVLSQNLGVAFLNRLSDQDFLQKQTVPDDPSLFVVHRSDQGMFGLYGTSSYTDDGLRDHVNQLAPAELCRESQPIDCQRKEPISEELDAHIERHTGPSRQRAPVLHDEYQDSVIPKPPSPSAESPPPSTWHPLFQQMTDAAMSGDARGIEMAGRAYAHSAEGQVWLGQGQQLNDALAQQAQQAQQAEQAQQQAAQQAMAASEAQTQRGPVMRM
jgi:hypothetical protein